MHLDPKPWTLTRDDAQEIRDHAPAHQHGQTHHGPGQVERLEGVEFRVKGLGLRV
jgi:hypothetical protein